MADQEKSKYTNNTSTEKEGIVSSFVKLQESLRLIDAGAGCPLNGGRKSGRNEPAKLDAILPYIKENEMSAPQYCDTCTNRKHCPLCKICELKDLAGKPADIHKEETTSNAKDTARTEGTKNDERKESSKEEGRKRRGGKTVKKRDRNYSRKDRAVTDFLNGSTTVKEVIVKTGPEKEFTLSSLAPLLFEKSSYPMFEILLVLVLVINMKLLPSNVVWALEKGPLLPADGTKDTVLNVPTVRTIYRWVQRWKDFCAATGHCVEDIVSADLQRLCQLCREGHEKDPDPDAPWALPVLTDMDGQPAKSLTLLYAYFFFILLIAPFVKIAWLRVVCDKKGGVRICPVCCFTRGDPCKRNGGLSPVHSALETWLNWQKHFPAKERTGDRHVGSRPTVSARMLPTGISQFIL